MEPSFQFYNLVTSLPEKWPPLPDWKEIELAQHHFTPREMATFTWLKGGRVGPAPIWTCTQIKTLAPPEVKSDHTVHSQSFYWPCSSIHHHHITMVITVPL
jgi:hypothetical protein